MADKFSKVKRFGVIVWREFWGFWMGGPDGAGGGAARGDGS